MRALLTLVVAVILTLLSGCQELPAEHWERLQAARQALAASPAVPFAVSEVAEFEHAYHDLEVDYRRAANQFAPFRDPNLETRLSQLADWGRQIQEQGRLRREFALARVAERLDWLQARLDEVDLRRLTPKMRMSLTRCELSFNMARQKWEQGEVGAASEAIDQFLARYENLQTLIRGVEDRYRDAVLLDLWDQWRRRLIARSRTDASPVLLVNKQARRADLLRSGKVVASFPVDLGWNPYGEKLQHGDGATPEGEYKVIRKKQGGQTRYHLALLLDYPNRRDRQLFRMAKELGEVGRRATPGGMIEVHGFGGQQKDWTDGCIALSDQDMDELFNVAYVGMPVTIVGTVQE